MACELLKFPLATPYSILCMKEKTMNYRQLSVYGFLLTMALLGGCAAGTSSTDEDRKFGHGDRSGGQAGMEQHIEKGTAEEGGKFGHGDRVGGQAGMEEHEEKGTAGSGSSAERTGGQGGTEVPLEKGSTP
jgi:hypothetical protein